MASTAIYQCKNPRCKEHFVARVADRKRGWARFCSKSCKALVQEKRTGQFERYLNSSDGIEYCDPNEDNSWDAHKEWTGKD